jgi:putative transposase
MPRVARRKSNIQIYHVMFRGIDKSDIFHGKSDYLKFLYCILNAREKSIFTVYAYCLMTNHVHILLKAESEELGDTLRRIAVGYALYYNNKYGRVGHLFQNRFKSEPIDSDSYFLSVIRYIHQNPIKAGIVTNLSNYPWSSYLEYIGKDMMNIVDTTFVLELFSSIEAFKEFIMRENDDMCLEYSTKKIYTDDILSNIISSISDINNLHLLNIISRNAEIKKIKEQTGASNRQLSRVLNIGRGVLERIK